MQGGLTESIFRVIIPFKKVVDVCYKTCAEKPLDSDEKGFVDTPLVFPEVFRF